MPDKSLAAVAARLRRKIRASIFSTAPHATATGREAPILLLATRKPRSYNTQVAALLLCTAIFPRTSHFEDFGKRVDEELARVKSFVKEEVAPETEKRTAQFLREVSEKLGEAAAWIEARNAARSAQPPKDAQS